MSIATPSRTAIKMLTSALLTLTLSACFAATSSAQTPFPIAISANQTTFKAGSPIELQVIFTNMSDRGITLFWDKSDKAELSGFGVEVTDAKGNTPKITQYCNGSRSLPRPRAFFVTLFPAIG